MNKALLTLVCFILFFSLNIYKLKAMPRHAKIVFKKGIVLVLNPQQKKWQSYNPTIKLKEGDIIRTGRRSRAEIRFDDGSRIRILSNTTIVLQKYLTGKKGRNSNVKLNKGGLYLNVRKLKRKSKFRVSTVTATVGVRGTIFYIRIDKKKNVKVKVKNGVVVVKAQGKQIKVKKNQGAIIKSGHKPILIRQSEWAEPQQ